MGIDNHMGTTVWRQNLTLTVAFLSNLYILQVMYIIHDKITDDTCTFACQLVAGDVSDMSSLSMTSS